MCRLERQVQPFDSTFSKGWEATMFTIEELATIPLFSALKEKELEYLAGAVEDGPRDREHREP